ncbi:hypothetical protein J6590_004050 [Homalodisca vitripennis]|nr:hypothetical protein J6590_004050 [Homalodisca vitripennis]
MLSQFGDVQRAVDQTLSAGVISLVLFHRSRATVQRPAVVPQLDSEHQLIPTWISLAIPGPRPANIYKHLTAFTSHREIQYYRPLQLMIFAERRFPPPAWLCRELPSFLAQSITAPLVALLTYSVTGVGYLWWAVMEVKLCGLCMFPRLALKRLTTRLLTLH